MPDDLLARACDISRAYLGGLASRHVGARAPADALRRELGGPLPDSGRDPAGVIEALAASADRGLVASPGPRYFGFVTGGSLPAALAADWLTSAWDQNGALFASSPAAAVVEEVATGWVLELLGLPATTGIGLVTGCQMANFTGLAAARHAVLARAGWDLASNGLRGAPPIRLVAGAEAHATLFSALRMLGFGSREVTIVDADEQGRLDLEALARALEDADGPVIVCAQAGNVNTGACDALRAIADLASARGAWLHVDGAFGLWAAVAPARRDLVAGFERADSLATDAHKWLNVPYDCGIAIVRDADAHRAAMTSSAAYLERPDAAGRDPLDWVPEASRRARGFALYAALRSLGRRGVGDLVERCCRLASLMADRLRVDPAVEIMNDVVLNQVLVRFHRTSRGTPGQAGSGVEDLTRAVIERVQREGTCWAGGTVWHGVTAMRISISNWSTTSDDVERSATAILEAVRQVRLNLG
jgi:glutamate/tyrosine decarboxylase-like PLP-dependent enzyme